MIEYEALCDRNPQRPLFIYGLGKTNYIQVNEIGFDNIGVDAATTGSSGGHGSRSESTESAVPGGRRNHFPGHHAGEPGERVAVKRTAEKEFKRSRCTRSVPAVFLPARSISGKKS